MGFFTFISFSKSLPLFLLALVIASSHSSQDLPSVQHPQCVYEHFSALLELKTGLQFSFHQGKDYYHSKTNLSSWNPQNRDCCSWEGITCDRATGHVTSLCLGELHLSGMINLESLCRIQSLRILNLAYNEFDQTPFPSAIANLTSLTHLNLSDDTFYGQIPLEMSSLTRLVSLDLSLNGYYDDDHNLIPLKLESIGALIQNMSSLRKLNLGYVDMSAEDSKWSQVISSALPNLRMLSMYSCIVSGTLHTSWLTNLTKLEYLNLSDNDLSGIVPSSLFTLPSLRTLILWGNQLGGQLSEFHNSSSSPLETIAFNGNKLQGMIPMSICNVSSLKTFEISFNDFGGHIPECLGETSNTLEKLYLNANQLQGKLPASLANCKHLTILNLGNNQIHDTFPTWVHGLVNLRILILRSNKFYGPIKAPPTCRNFSRLQIVDISFNDFHGSLPPAMFCGWTKLTGEDRSQPVYLETLADKFVYYYDQVTITSKKSEMDLWRISTADTVVDLSRNQFQGPIPESIGTLKSLWVLNLSHNGFTGQIPSSFKNLAALESLDLSQNKLSGNIPQELSELTFLEVLNLSENQLTGSIPHAKQFSTFTNESFQGNPGLCGPPLTKACEDTNDAPPSSSEDTELFSESEYNWKMIAIGFGIGYGVGVGVFCWTLVLWTRGRIAYNRFVYAALSLIFSSAV